MLNLPTLTSRRYHYKFICSPQFQRTGSRLCVALALSDFDLLPQGWAEMRHKDAPPCN
jgi:hypothetical protein